MRRRMQLLLSIILTAGVCADAQILRECYNNIDSPAMTSAAGALRCIRLANAQMPLVQIAYVPFGHYIGTLAITNTLEAVPDLELLQAKALDPLVRLDATAALIRLGDAKPEYWRDLVQAADRAIASDMPSPVTIGFDQVNPAFREWADAHHVTLQEGQSRDLAYEEAMVSLGMAADPRGEELLLKALKSPNVTVRFAAVMSLAEMKHEAAVPTILSAIAPLSPEWKSGFAHAILYFDDERAQAFVREWLPRHQEAPELRRKEPTPFSYFLPKDRQTRAD